MRRSLAPTILGLVLVTATAPPSLSEIPATARTRLVCWMVNGEGLSVDGDLERFLIDRLGASANRVAVEPATMHAVTRRLGLADRRTFDPIAAKQLAHAAQADVVVWVKMVSRDLNSDRLLSIPYLFPRRRLDAHVFFDVRLYDVAVDSVIGSKRLKLTERGDRSWQVLEDDRFDPAYNNDPVEIHERLRRLDWRAAAAISRFCMDTMDHGGHADTEPEPPMTQAPPR